MSIDFVGGFSPSFGHLYRSQKWFLNFTFMPGKIYCKWVGPLWENCKSKFHEARAILAFGSLCAAPKTVSVMLFWSSLWGTFKSPNHAQVFLLEIPSCLLSNPSVISKFGVHFPLQNGNLLRLLPMCQNRGREVIFWVFMTSWRLKSCTNFLYKNH